MFLGEAAIGRASPYIRVTSEMTVLAEVMTSGGCILSSFCFFEVLSFTFSWVYSSYTRLSDRLFLLYGQNLVKGKVRRWRVKNTTVSLCHSLISGVSAVAAWVFRLWGFEPFFLVGLLCVVAQSVLNTYQWWVAVACAENNLGWGSGLLTAGTQVKN